MCIMETMGKKKPRPRRSFTAEFKADIVQRCRQGDRTVRQIALDFDLTETAVRAWTKQAEIDDGTRTDGLTSDEAAELRSLRAENRRLQQDVDDSHDVQGLLPGPGFLVQGFPERGAAVHLGTVDEVVQISVSLGAGQKMSPTLAAVDSGSFG
jgi:transposase